jgi:hypothetical protein
VKFCLVKVADRWFPGHHSLQFVLETIVYFVLVAVLWYVVSVELGGRGQSVLASRTGMRSAADILAIILGAALGLVGFLVRRQFGYVSTYSTLVAVPYFIWGAAIAVFYGHDPWECLGTVEEEPTG